MTNVIQEIKDSLKETKNRLDEFDKNLNLFEKASSDLKRSVDSFKESYPSKNDFLKFQIYVIMICVFCTSFVIFYLLTR